MLKNKPTYEELEKRVEKLEKRILFSKNLIDLLPGRIFIKDKHGVFLYVNKATAIFLNKKPDEIVGKHHSEINNDKELVSEYLSEDKNVIEEKITIFHDEKKYKDLKGIEKWYKTIKVPYKSPITGDITVLCVCDDISQKKIAEDELKIREERMSKALDALSDSIWDWNVKTGEIFYTPNFFLITGYEPDDYKASFEEWKKRVHPDDINKTIFLINEHLKGKTEKYRSEYRYKKKNGDWIWILSRGELISGDEKGNAARMIGTHADITKKKKSEIEHIKSRKKLSLHIEQSPLAAIEWDLNFKVTLWNKSAERIFGFTKEEAVGKHATDLILSNEFKERLNKVWKSLLARKGGQRSTNKNITKRGEQIICEWYNTTLIDSTGEAIGVASLAQDITEQTESEEKLKAKNLEIASQNEEYLSLNEELIESNETIRKINQELKQAKEKAEESDKLKSAFLANMSHEIRTPMNGILGFSNMLEKKNLTDEKRAHFIKIIIESGNQLLNIVNSILDLAKIETGQVSLRKKEFYLNDLIMELFSFFKPKARENSISFYMSNGLKDENSLIVADRSKLRQVFVNIISNAIKFTAKGYIKFGYNLKENELEFFVEDTGTGIHPEKHTIIFDRFIQTKQGMLKHGSTGLGLSICKAYVELMGGRIWLESQLGNGTTFYFTVHYSKKNKQNKGNENEKTDIYPKVLVVEDEEINFIFIKETLKTFNVDLLHARSGYEAIEIYNKNKNIQLVLLDIKLPDITGYEVAEKLLSINKEIPIIAQTAYAMTEDKEKALSSGCVDYLSKPIQDKRLKEILVKYTGVEENE